MPGKPPRRLGQDQHAGGEDRARDGAKREHPAPLARLGEDIADEIGDQNAAGDRELIERDQGARLLAGAVSAR
jgi:hypothetical protein